MRNLEVDTPSSRSRHDSSRAILYRRRRLSFTDVEGSLDSTIPGGVQLRGTGRVIDGPPVPPRDVGAEAAKWVSPGSGFSPRTLPRTSFTATGSTFSWGKGGAVVVEATLARPEGLYVLALPPESPGAPSIDPVADTGRGVGTRCDLRPDRRRREAEFTGTLSRSTVGNVVRDPGKARPTDQGGDGGRLEPREPGNPRPAGRWRRTIRHPLEAVWLPSRSGIFPFRGKGRKVRVDIVLSLCGTRSVLVDRERRNSMERSLSRTSTFRGGHRR